MNAHNISSSNSRVSSLGKVKRRMDYCNDDDRVVVVVFVVVVVVVVVVGGGGGGVDGGHGCMINECCITCHRSHEKIAEEEQTLNKMIC